VRYYNIVITGAPAAFPARYDGGGQWGTEIGGKYDSNAQDIEFSLDAFTGSLGEAPEPAASEPSTLTIFGVSWDQIKVTNQLVGKEILIYGGMRPGLPLATYQSAYKGFLLRANILKAWGNWVGTDMSIGMSLVVSGTQQSSSSDSSSSAPSGDAGSSSSAPTATPGATLDRTGLRSIDQRGGNNVPTIAPRDVGGSFTSMGDMFGGMGGIGSLAGSLFGGGTPGLIRPLNLIHNLLPNMPMSDAIQQTLSKAFPKANLNINISPQLKLPYQDAGAYQNIPQYASYLKKISQSIMGSSNYHGIQISSHGNTLDVWDHPIGEGHIQFGDLIGQPTWIDFQRIHVKTILRSDIRVGMNIDIPQGILMQMGPDSIMPFSSTQRSNISIPGTFIVEKVLHIGAFRNPDGNYWCTNIEASASQATQLQDTPTPNAPITPITPAEQLSQGVAPLSAPTTFKRSVRRYG